MNSSSCFGLGKAKHAGQFNAQNGGTIEKFCLFYPSLSSSQTASVAVTAALKHYRFHSGDTPVFFLTVVWQDNSRDGVLLSAQIRASLSPMLG